MQIMTPHFDSVSSVTHAPFWLVHFFHLIRQTVINEACQLPKTHRTTKIYSKFNLQVDSHIYHEMTWHYIKMMTSFSVCFFFWLILKIETPKSFWPKWFVWYLYLFLRMFSLFFHCSHKMYVLLHLYIFIRMRIVFWKKWNNKNECRTNIKKWPSKVENLIDLAPLFVVIIADVADEIKSKAKREKINQVVIEHSDEHYVILLK